MPLWRIMVALCVGCAAVGLSAAGLQKLADRKIDGYWMVPQTDGGNAYRASVPDVTRIHGHSGQVDIHQSASMISMADDVTLLLDGKPHPWKSQVSVFGFPAQMHAYEAHPTGSGFVVTEYLTDDFTGQNLQYKAVISWAITQNGKRLEIKDGDHTVSYTRVSRMRELFFDRF